MWREIRRGLVGDESVDVSAGSRCGDRCTKVGVGLKILLDGYWLSSGPPSGHGLIRAIVDNWALHFPDDEVSVLVPTSKVPAADATSAGTKILTTRLRLHPLINWFGLWWADRRHGPFDLVLSQNFSTPSGRSAVFIHDVLFQSNAEWFTWKERLYFHLMTLSAPWSNLVLTSSDTERARILKHNPRLKRVVATGLGLPRRQERISPTDIVDGLIPGRFVLSVGRLNVRKNLTRTIEGAVASGTLSATEPLVVVGETSGRSARRTIALSAAESRGEVVYLGFVSDADLQWLLSNCCLMVFLSLDEGYGLPPLEAAAAGARVLVSDIPVMREVMGASATYVDPLDVPAISRAIRDLVNTGDGSTSRSTAPGARPWSDVIATMRGGIVALG
jgi:glycosyltransferase involved in cell wall biosynthesis